MRYGLKTGKRNHFNQFGQAPIWSSWQPLLLFKLQMSPLGSTTPELRQQLSMIRTSGKEFKTPRTHSRSGSKINSPALVTLGLVNSWQKLEDSSALFQLHPVNWLVDVRWKLEDPVIKIWMGFHCHPGPFPDRHYCCALCYRTSFSHTPGLEFGSEAAVSCLLSHRSGEYHPY